MIANALNTILGIWLAYIAVLDPSFVNNSTWHLPVLAIAVIVLAAAARPGDYLKWASTTNIVAGIVLLLLAGLRWSALAPDLLMFWGVFWSGIVVSVLALWAALYRPQHTANANLEPANHQ